MKHFFLTLALASSALYICCSESEPTINHKELVKLNEDMHHAYFKKTDYSKDSYLSSAYWQTQHAIRGTDMDDLKKLSLHAALGKCKANNSEAYLEICSRKEMRESLQSSLYKEERENETDKFDSNKFYKDTPLSMCLDDYLRDSILTSESYEVLKSKLEQQSDSIINHKQLIELNDTINHNFFKKTDYSEDSYFSSAYWQTKKNLALKPGIDMNSLKKLSLDAALEKCKGRRTAKYRLGCSSDAINQALHRSLFSGLFITKAGGYAYELED